MPRILLPAGSTGRGPHPSVPPSPPRRSAAPDPRAFSGTSTGLFRARARCFVALKRASRGRVLHRVTPERVRRDGGRSGGGTPVPTTPREVPHGRGTQDPMGSTADEPSAEARSLAGARHRIPRPAGGG